MLTPAGFRARLDELLGPGFAVVGLDCDPRALVGEAAVWAALGARFVRILSKQTSLRMTDECVYDAIDESGALQAWFDRHGAALAVVRPDRFVYGAASVGEAAALVRALAADLRVGEGEVGEVGGSVRVGERLPSPAFR